MSKRYVFGQYNVASTTTTTYTGVTVASSETMVRSTNTTFKNILRYGKIHYYIGLRIYYLSSSADIDDIYTLSTLTYTSTSTATKNGISVYEQVLSFFDSDDYYSIYTSNLGIGIGAGYYNKMCIAVLDSNDIDDVYSSSYVYNCGLAGNSSAILGYDEDDDTYLAGYLEYTAATFTTESTTTYSQGTTFYNYLYGNSSSSYTTGQQTSGDYSGYWITYIGYDYITPTLAITKSGYDMTSTITASSSTTYGGTIYYLLETACNDGDYEEVQDSTATTYTETVDSDTAYYYSRVTAYCTGFTDETVTASYTISQTGTRYVWDKLDEEGGTSQGYVASSSLSAYPLDAEDDDGYWYDYLGSDTPDATAVSATTTGKAGATVTLKITAAGSSSNVYGGTIYYTVKRYHRTSSSGSYSSTTVSSKTTSTTVTTTIPTGGYYDCYYTVTTLDSYGYVGTTAVSTSVITIINNEAPTVTITDIGTVTDAFDITFAIADEDGDEMDVTLALDGTTLTTWSDQTDGTLSYTIDSDTLLKLLNGSHTVTVTATDSSETTTATATFTKAVYTCSATWNEAKTTDGLITKLYMGWVGSIPDDATVSMLVTNDNGVTWEDASDAFLDGDTYTFSTSSADTTAFNFSLTITRGDTEGYIDDIMFVLSTGDASEYGNTVCTLTHIESNGVHTFSGLNGRTGMIPVQFKSTSANTDGDTDAELDGEDITLQTVSGGDVYWLTGRGIMAVVDTEDAVMTLQM